MIDVPVRVKDALRDGSLPKEYQIIVYQEDETTVDFTIGNDNLVSESVKYDERMCSDSTLKFGLCEGASIEFQAFGIPNITGRRIKVNIRVQYYSVYGLLSWETIPLGYFTVKETSRQASTGILKITAYNKLQSDYLDAKANALIQETFGNLETVYATDILNALLTDYAIDKSVVSMEGVGISGIQTNYTNESRKYSTLYGDNGVFSPGFVEQQFKINGSTFSTSSTIRFIMAASWIEYSFDAHIYPVRVRFDDDMDAFDAAIAKIVNESLQANIASSASLLNLLATHEWTSGTAKVGIKSWYLHAEVWKLDGTVEYYGKTLFDLGLARGTFKDLNLITLSDVNKVYIVFPMQILIDGKLSGSYWGGADFNLTSDSDTYATNYYPSKAVLDSGAAYTTVRRPKPKFSNGDALTAANVKKHTVVGQILNTTAADMVSITLADMQDITLRDLQTAVFETTCEYGQLDRKSDLFKGVTLNNKRLYPAESLYPNTALYPTSANEDGQAERANRSMYSKLWADEGNIRSFRYLIITYKGTETDESGNLQEVEKRLQRTIDKDGTDDYNMSSNWLFKNLVWTEEDVGTYADAMVSNLRNVTWFPFEMWCAGLPYIETGDEVEINMNDEAYTSYVLRRSMSGIQNLQDEMINGTLDIF